MTEKTLAAIQQALSVLNKRTKRLENEIKGLKALPTNFRETREQQEQAADAYWRQ